MRSFLAVADAGAITEASARINVSQPALSRRIQQLEDYLQADLLVRGRKGIELTEIGHIVAAEGRILVSRYDQLRTQVASVQGLEGGTVRIGGGAICVYHHHGLNGFELVVYVCQYRQKIGIDNDHPGFGVVDGISDLRGG